MQEALATHLAGVDTLTFVPYAAVTLDWDSYTGMVADALAPLGIAVQSVHATADPVPMLAAAQAIAIGGGNTFHLLAALQQRNLLPHIRERVHAGVPYVGWSAGSVMACPTIQTTNDMPVIAPVGFSALALVNFQINAHFTDVHPLGFRGETRRERLAEYVAVNKDRVVIGLPEGDWLRVHGACVWLEGAQPAPLFRFGRPNVSVQVGDEISATLERHGR